MQISARDLALMLNGTVEGNPDVLVNRPSKIEEGGEGSIAFLANPKYEVYAYTTTASVLLVSDDFVAEKPMRSTLIRVKDVYATLAFLLEKFGQNDKSAPREIARYASVHETTVLGKNVAIGDFSVVSKNAEIGENTIIHPQVFIGEKVKIGANCELFPGVRIYHSCVLGDNCVVHANAVIGGDGFGFAPQPDGTFKKIAQIGNVVIENNVEIGANTTIDRATLGSTIIRTGVKIDNLVQIGHNVEIGQNTVIAAQAGVAGSTKIGKNCMIGGQVGFAGHLKIADGTKIQAQSGISASVETPGTAIFGSPAIPYNEYIKSYAVFKKLPELYKKIARLEKIISDRNATEDVNS